MAKRKHQLPQLSPAQREIMEIVWQLGEVSVSDVRAELSKRRPVARNTVRTLLERMEEKGWLTHREEGRTYHYRAAQPRKATVGEKVIEVVEQLCGGSPETLVAALLDYRGLTKPELQRIRRLLDDAQSQRTPSERGEG